MANNSSWTKQKCVYCKKNWAANHCWNNACGQCCGLQCEACNMHIGRRSGGCLERRKQEEVLYLDQSLQQIHDEIANQIQQFVGGSNIVQMIVEYSFFRVFCGNSTCRQFLPYRLQCGCFVPNYQIQRFWCKYHRSMQSLATLQPTREILCKCGLPICDKCCVSHQNSLVCWQKRDSQRLLSSRISYSFYNLL